jgi:hypothetical protein
MACTWTIVTNLRTLEIRGEGSPVIVAGNARCIGVHGNNINLLRLSGENEGYCAYTYETILSSTSSNCQGISNAQPYDCINGGCIPKTTYNTPGVFASLAACESGCAKNSNCTGECVSTDEIAALQQAASALQARLCK